eukprot:gene14724-5824_t
MTPRMEDFCHWLTMVGGRKVDAEDGGTKSESMEAKGDDKELEEDDKTFGNDGLFFPWSLARTRRHSLDSYHRRSSIGSTVVKKTDPRLTGIFTEMFRLNLESKVAKKLYGHQRNIDEENYEQLAMGKYVIHPMSDFRFYWDMIIVVILFVQIFVLPVSIAFYSGDFSVAWLCINGISDTIFIFDIIFNFHTGIPDHENEHLTILDKRIIRRRYLKGWFFLDLCSSLPLEYVFLIIESTDRSTAIVKASRGFKILKLVKMLTLLKLFRLSRLVRYIRRFEDATNITTSHLRILKLLALMLLLGHWSGCLQYLVPYLQDFPADSWVVREGLLEASVWRRYTWSVFRAMSHMLSIGYGRMPPHSTTDAWLTLLSMMIGGAFYAVFIGGISTISMAIDASGRMYNEKVQQVSEYLKFRKLPRSLRDKVHDYYEHRFQRKCFDEEKILKEVSPSLREEILMYHLGDLLRSVPFFKNAESEFLEELVLVLNFEVYLANEVICKGGRKGNKMFFIEQGIVEVVSPKGEITASLGKGSHFGEISLLSKEARRIATVRARTQCDLFSLSCDDFNDTLKDYPHMKEVLRRVAEARLHNIGASDSVGNIDPQFWNCDVVDLESSGVCPNNFFKKKPTLFCNLKNSDNHSPSGSKQSFDKDTASNETFASFNA